MTYAEFQAQVEKLALTVETIAAQKVAIVNFPNTDYSLDVCECVAAITGFSATWVKMFNRKFRTDAAAASFEMALARAA